MSWYLDGWKRTFNFSGESTRLQFWTFSLVNLLIIYLIYTLMFASLVYDAGSAVDTSLAWIMFVFSILYLFASWSISVRRLHDAGHSGWCLLLGLIPVIGVIILFVFFVQPSR